ncbi:MAG TPA: sodium-dependent transporter [Victivallales bacterium]|nr:sodium-dependent transporter [Victivallales bacterium]HPO90919.1 sodium-dependent transporter [Victivallales bacterium]HRR27983.1 sodium-dependent transporter [Victivallales bacterium]HRU01694.1 sodium-dependent transporter [Victivallales bacterium]
MEGKREHWSGNIGFILASAGSAIGLGNIWKFPYITGENGGGAFVLIYLFCILLIGIPVMLCEFTIGRHTQKGPVGAFNALKPKSCNLAHTIGALIVIIALALMCFGNYGWAILFLIIGGIIFISGWTFVGIMGVVAGFIILSFYSVVAGWTIGYIWHSLSDFWAGDNSVFAASDSTVKTFLTFINGKELTASDGAIIAKNLPWYSIICHITFMIMCMAIVYKGVKEGIEKWSKILMPFLFVLLIALILRALSLPGSIEGIKFYLTPRFGMLATKTFWTKSFLIALGHAFFSLSLGMGVMITYGSYLSKKENIFISTLSVAGLDTLVALMAGLAIFPAVFAMGMQPDSGPGLVFLVLPQVFHKMPLGPLWGTLFFVLLLVAALTSGISILEVVVSYFMDELKFPRHTAVIFSGIVIAALGCLCAVSVGDWSNLEWLHILLVKIFDIKKGNFFDVMDNIASNWMLPLGGMFIAIFTGWIWGTRHALNEIRHGAKNFGDVHLLSLLAGLKDDPSHNSDVHVLTLASLWGIFIRFISPLAILVAFLHSIGWIEVK